MKLARSTGKRRAAAALIVTLAFLVIITILAVGFVASMRTERLAASSMAANEQTKQVALSALSHAISLLASNIPDPGDPTVETPAGSAKNWFTNPGRLTVVDAASPPVTNAIPLHTGALMAADPLLGVNLNAATGRSGTYPITGADEPMWVAWRNLLQDDSQPAGATNKLVGRYAFWIDDEATKINVNVARGKPASMANDLKLPPTWANAAPRDLLPYMANTFSIGSKTYQVTHPAAVNVDTVGLDAVTLENAVATNGFLDSLEGVRAFYGTDAAYEAEKFNLTVFGRSPEFNVFGKSRIFLTKWASSTETGPAYQHAYHPEQPTTFYAFTMGVTSDANPTDPLYAQKIRQVQEPVVSSLARNLQRDDWPGFTGKRFRWVAHAQGSEESDQIAVNINSMISLSLRGSPGANAGWIVNDIASRTGIVGDFTVTGTYSNQASNVWKGPLTGKGMLGLQQFPQLSETGVRLTPVNVTGSTFKLQVELLQEVYLPPGYYRNDSGEWVGTGTGASANYRPASLVPYVQVQVTSGTTIRINATRDESPAADKWNFTSLLSNGPAVDSYCVFALPKLIGSGTAFVAATATTSAATFAKNQVHTINLKFRAGIGTQKSAFASQIAPFPISNNQAPLQGARPPGLAAVPDSGGYLEFNLTLNGADVDAMVTDPSLRPVQTMGLDDPRTAQRKLSWSNQTNETLGFPNDSSTANGSSFSKFALWNLNGGAENAGAVGMISLVPSGMQRGIPWDTLQFHSYDPGADLPDWLVLDLIAPAYGYPISRANSTAGKINLNSRIYPDDSPVFTPPVRVKPLQALFANMPNGAQAAAAVSSWQNASRGFDYVGRITEVPGVADNDQGALDFDKEVLLRNLAGMMTTQSNVFGIWGVAQTIRKRPGSTNYGTFEPGDTITGEKRFHAVVERYVWPGKDGTPGNGAVDASAVYAALASGVDPVTSPGMPPTETASTRVKTSDSTFRWPPLDGPQAPQLLPVHGTAKYDASTAEDANNPLAALIKYRILSFTYLD